MGLVRVLRLRSRSMARTVHAAWTLASWSSSAWQPSFDIRAVGVFSSARTCASVCRRLRELGDLKSDGSRGLWPAAGARQERNGLKVVNKAKC
eukprot:1088389-Prymnesium_polylepis.1